jgi:ubiquinone/menaquinone biosynthesis C-methylase UbiE
VVSIRECARVLRPGGRLIILDSLQRGDRPDYVFPQNYHEPYYPSYINENFDALAANCDLKPVRNVKAFVSKVMVFDKPLTRKGNVTPHWVSPMSAGQNRTSH